MGSIFRRTELATQMAQRLIHPGALDEVLRSGMFLSGMRRIGKTTFLVNDLIPALEAAGALVVYVDLWTDTGRSPSSLVHSAVRKTLDDLITPSSNLLEKLRRVSGVDMGGLGFKFGFKLESLGAPKGATLAEAFTEIVDQAKTDLVLIIDEVQHAITSDEGHQMLLALKAARDAINPRPNTPGHFILIGTGSHRAMVSELTARRNQAFSGAHSQPYPVLGADYVQYLISRLESEGKCNLPSLEVAVQAFNTLGNRPEELLKAFLQLALHTPQGADPNTLLPVIATTLRSAAADVEIDKLDQMGPLAVAVFDKIASSSLGAKGLYSADAAAEHSKTVGRDVRVEEIQPVVNELLAANLIMRLGHGLYGVTDPFVQEIWRERKTLVGLPAPAAD